MTLRDVLFNTEYKTVQRNHANKAFVKHNAVAFLIGFNIVTRNLRDYPWVNFLSKYEVNMNPYIMLEQNSKRWNTS